MEKKFLEMVCWGVSAKRSQIVNARQSLLWMVNNFWLDVLIWNETISHQHGHVCLMHLLRVSLPDEITLLYD